MRRRRKEEEESEEIIDAEEEGLIAERWSLTKILVGLVLFACIFGAAAYAFLYYKRYQESQGKNILGMQEVRDEPQLPTEEDIEETLETVQQEIEKIDPGNIFSSQESIQKIIQDLESLRNSSSDPKGAFCSAVCGTTADANTKTASQSAGNEITKESN